VDPDGAEPREVEESPEEMFARLGIEMVEPTGETQVIFLGPKGVAAIKKLVGRE
jgi:hypothetical protein